MICCKIIADYNNKDASFKNLLSLLSKKGDLYWSNGVLFFADTEGDITEKSLVRLYKKVGYTKVFVDVFDKDNEPNNDDEVIKSWISDKLVKIYYKQYEMERQQVFRETKRGLDEIEKEVDGIIRNAIKEQETKSQEAEDSK